MYADTLNFTLNFFEMNANDALKKKELDNEEASVTFFTLPHAQKVSFLKDYAVFVVNPVVPIQNGNAFSGVKYFKS